MSKGLGKVQTAIIDELNRSKGRKDGWHFVSDLQHKIYHPERFDEDGECYDWSYTRAEFVSFHRSIQSLENRGLVETKRHTSGLLTTRIGKGGQMIAKMVRMPKC